jgi:acyl-CoA synthetase (AMP-forming)/AMP-acid ligase II
MVMKGYLNKPDATADILTPDGWLRTGDVARIDSEGYTYIVDRVKELIKYKGYQVAPAELEAELLTSSDIADAAVIGAQLDGEEVPKAYVVRAQSAPNLTEQDVIDYIGARVSPHKKVRLVEFIDTIPKSASGKILRKDLRAR